MSVTREQSRGGAKEFADLLFEIGCEEIPAGMIARAAQELKAILANHLSAHGLVAGPTVQDSVETFGAARRLTAIARGLRMTQEDVTREIVGPPKSVAFDNLGEPTRAAMSFAERQGVPLSRLTMVSLPKGECLALRQVVPGRPAASILSDVLPQAIRDISWPRSMYWAGAQSARFIRPVRWITAIFGGETVPLKFADAASGNWTSGHRFLGKPKIPLRGPTEYESALRKNFVIARPEERQAKIESEIRALAAKKGLRAHADPALLDAVVYLNEYPSVILGDFDEEFLSLPEEILVTVMRDHQKYFALENRRGELAPHFLAVINLPRDPKGLVRAGHERVLRARFTDARFFWQSDQRIKLGGYLPKLAAVTYESRLGSYGGKVERMRALGRWIAEQWFSSGIAQADVAGVDRAAELAKCDLVTEMVREFSELQGIVGGLYARAQDEPEHIAWAVYDHYRPQGLGDSLPRNLAGCAVSLADKLDSLVACFSVGAIPTGSSDPFALRRAALGIVSILIERKLPLSISAAVSAAARGLKQYPPKIEAGEEVEKQALDFLLERARFFLRERRGFAYDEINAAFAAGADDLVETAERIAALKFIRGARNFPPLAASFKRVRNILEKSARGKDKSQGAVKPELLREAPELQLYTLAQKISREAAQRKRDGKYREALEKISELRPSVDLFFDKVLVMAEDDEIRRNRIALLSELLKEFSTIADFSLLGSEEPRAEVKVDS